MPPLTGAQWQQLSNALMSAFPTPFGLQEMLQFRLERSFFAFASAMGSYPATIYNLIQAAEAQGWTDALVAAAQASNPDNTLLIEFAQQRGMASTTIAGQQLQRLINRSQGFLNVAQWRSRLGQIETRVCRIEFSGNARGTGFLIAPDWVMTNYHVVEPIVGGDVAPSEVEVRFDYKKLEDGTTLNYGTTYRLASDWLVAKSEPSPVDEATDPGDQVPAVDQLDFALIALADQVGNLPVGSKPEPGAPSRGWIKQAKTVATFEPDTTVLIMQHPLGSPLKLAIDALIGLNGNGTRVRYSTNTEPGSSGSPCFDVNWNLIALHHSGDADLDPLHQPTYNQGIPIGKIREHLAKEDIHLEEES